MKPYYYLFNILFFLLFISSPANSQTSLIAADSFASSAGGDDYAIGALYAQSPTASTTGFAGAAEWTNSGDQTTSHLQTSASALSAALLVEPASPGLIRTSGTNSIPRALFRQLDNFTPGDTSYFFSYALRSQHGNRGAFGLSAQGALNNGSPFSGVSVGVSDASGTDDIVLWVNGSDTVLHADYTSDATYFVLVQIENNSAGSDSVTVKLFEETEADINTPIAQISNVSGEISSGLSHLGLMKADHISGSGFEVDEFRMGASLDSVVKVSPNLVYIGSRLVLQHFRDSPWDGSGSEIQLSANFELPDNGGTTAQFTFSDPLESVDVNTPSAPDASGATSSNFGLSTNSGFGVGGTDVGRFERGEQFTLQADHRFLLEQLELREYSGDEVLHLQWTEAGVSRSENLVLDEPGSAQLFYALPIEVIADANTPIIITNVSAATAHSAGRIRVMHLITSPVFGSAPSYTVDSSDGYIQMFGVNIAGAEFGETLPGTHGTDYFYPQAAEIEYYSSKAGTQLIRLPFRWERIQLNKNEPLVAAELALMKDAVAEIHDNGMKVILDMHNYARYKDHLIGSSEVPLSAFQDVWARLAAEFKDSPAIYGYGLMNEPHGTNGTWPSMAQAGIDGVRSVDSDNWIIVAGDSWSSARNWYTANPNLNVQDSSDKIIYEAHCYFDDNASGKYTNTYDADNVYPNIGVVEVSPFIRWLKENDARGFVGEYGVPDDDPRWNAALERFMHHLGVNGVSGTYWAGGSYWSDYKLSVHPTSNFTIDRPQMSVIEQDFTADGLSTQTPTVEVVIDSEATEGVTLTGNWPTSTAAPGYLGQNYLHDGHSELGSKSVTFAPELPTAGSYEVYLNWTASGNRASNAPVDIIHSSGTDLVQVDQKSNGGTWVSLGIYDFNAGSSGSVIIRNDGANGYVIADAVRFVPR